MHASLKKAKTSGVYHPNYQIAVAVAQVCFNFCCGAPEKSRRDGTQTPTIIHPADNMLHIPNDHAGIKPLPDGLRARLEAKPEPLSPSASNQRDAKHDQVRAGPLSSTALHVLARTCCVCSP